MKKSLILTVAALSAMTLSAMTLSACGKMADLEAPAARSKWTERNREPATVLRPSSSNPIDGGAADPTGRRQDY